MVLNIDVAHDFGCFEKRLNYGVEKALFAEHIILRRFTNANYENE